MKQKHLFLLLLFMLMGGGSSWAAPADFLTGWTEVTELPTDNAQLEQNYYVLVEGDMMVGQDYATAPDTQEGKRTAVYVTPCDPTTNTKVVWLLSYSNDYEYGLRCYAFQDRFMQSRGNEAYRLQAEWEANQSQWTRMAFAYADGTWTIQNRAFATENWGTNYWGSWGEDTNRYNNGYCLAGNKGYNGSDTYVGHFKIYSIARSKYTLATGIYSMPYSTDFASKNPFNGGSVVNGGSVQSVLNVNNTTATAWFNVGGGENHPYELQNNEEVTVSFTAFHGWLTNGANQTVTLYNSDDVVLAQYTYNLGACNLTGVTVAGQAQSVTAYNCQSFSNYGGRNANGLTGNQSYKTTDGYNPVFTFVVTKSGRCFVNVKYSHHNIDNTYVANVAEGVKMNLAKLVISSGSNNGDRTICIDNLNISSEIKETPKADYTIKYVDENEVEIKPQAIGNDEVGANPVLSGSDKATFVDGDKKYVYASDDAASQTIAEDGSTIVTIHFNTLHKYNYSVRNSLGATFREGSLFTDEIVDVTWSKYVNVDGTWYVTEAPYGVTITSEAPTKTVEYTEANDVAYFFEAESILSRSYGNPNGFYSGGTSAAVYNGATLTMSNIAAGGYTITLNTTVRRTNEDQFKVQVSTDGTNWEDAGVITLTDNKAGDYSIENVVLPSDGTIRLVENKGQNQCHYVDYVVLTKLSSATMAVNATAKYGTFCAPFDVVMPAGVTAYTAEIEEGRVKLTERATETQTLPAHTPVVLNAAEGLAATTFYGKATAGTPTAGVLTGVYEKTQVTAGTNCYLLQNGPSGVAFYLVNQDAYLAANRCYMTVTNGARAILFDGEETAIDNIKTNATEVIYDLAGRKVMKAQKGLYIVNGKKVIR